MLNDPTNDVKKLQMIAELEQMETNPNIGTQSFLSQTKAASQFTYFRALFERIMVDGSALVNEGRYVEAAELFYSGFYLYRDDFFAQGYEKSFITPVTDSLQTIADTLPEYGRIQERLNRDTLAFVTAANAGNLTASQTAFVQIATAMGELASVRNTIARAGWLFQNSFAQLVRENPEITEASYLPFLYRFTLGRASDSSTGIVGAIDRQWDALMNGMKDAGYAAVNLKWRTAVAGLETNGLFTMPATHTASRRNFGEADSFALLSIQVNEFYALLEKSAGTPYSEAYPEYRAGMELAQSFGKSAVTELDTVKIYTDLMQKSQAYSLPAAAAADIQTNNRQHAAFFIQSADRLAGLVLESEQNLAQIKTTYETYGSGYASLNPPDFAFQYTELEKLCAEVTATAAREESQSMLRLAKYIAGGALEVAALHEKSHASAQNKLTGTVEADTGRVNHYPAEAAAEMQKTLEVTRNDIKNLQELRELLAAADITPDFSGEYTAQLANVTTSITTLQGVLGKGQSLITRANEQSLLAGKALQEAEMRYNQANTALLRSDYQAARDNLQLSRQRYNQSLDYQESTSLRTSADAKLAALGQSISRAENEVVIVQVRSLINQAKTAYYAGNFETADRLLNQAKTRWEITNVDPNPEIIQWLTLTGTAITLKTGRVIPVTAPLYPEMSQLLSVANQFYEQGEKLIAAGRRDEAVFALNQARQKIREVQLVYPINQEAGLLALKVDKLIDPGAFETAFKNRYDQVMREYKNPDTQQAAYADLLNLAQINPRYPGIKNAIDTVEIYMGIKTPPPDPRTLSRSNALIAQARGAANSTNEIELRTAIARLDEALKLTPDNEEAALLKDRMQSRLGGQAIVVLSAESERLYQQAVQELQRNNVINAAALLAQLLKDANNKKSPKVLDLQLRINILTGQVN